LKEAFVATISKPAKPVAKAGKPVSAKPPMKAPAPVAAKTVTAPVATPPVTKPVAAPMASAIAIEAVAQPVPAPAVAPAVEIPAPKTPAAAMPVEVAPVPQKEMNMNDTMTKVQETIKTNTDDATAKASAFFTDANGRAKDAMAKGTKALEEMVEFSKGNMEAFATSGRIAAKGAEEIAKYSVEYGRGTIEKANATAKRFAEVKSPTEFFQLQSEVAKSTLDAVVAEGSKFTESYLKLLGEMVQPIQNRYAVAVEKVNTTVAA
jgi:phasin family protein